MTGFCARSPHDSRRFHIRSPLESRATAAEGGEWQSTDGPATRRTAGPPRRSSRSGGTPRTTASARATSSAARSARSCRSRATSATRRPRSTRTSSRWTRATSTIEDVAEDYVHCTMCGACELRCPNTLFTGDFYRFRPAHGRRRQGDARARGRGGHPPGELEALGRADRPLGQRARARLEHRDLRGARSAPGRPGLDIPTGGETILFADCEAAFYRPSVPRAVALLLQARRRRVRAHEASSGAAAGRCGRPGYVDVAHKMAEHNMIDWRKTGTKRIICLDPHDYITIIEHYPDARRELRRVRDRARRRPGRRADPRRQAPADDADRAHGHVPRSVPAEQAPRQVAVARGRSCGRSRGSRSSTSTTSPSGRTAPAPAANLAIEKPELTAEISRRRVEKAAALDGVDTLVSACPWSERPLDRAGQGAGDRGLRHLRAGRRGGRIRGLTMAVAALPDTLIDELVAICGEEHVFTGQLGALQPRARALAVPGAPVGGLHPAGGRPADLGRADLRGRQAREPPPRPGRAARGRHRAHRRRRAAASTGSSST